MDGELEGVVCSVEAEHGTQAWEEEALQEGGECEESFHLASVEQRVLACEEIDVQF